MILSYPSSLQESMLCYHYRTLHLGLGAGNRLDDRKSSMGLLCACFFDKAGESGTTRQGDGDISNYHPPLPFHALIFLFDSIFFDFFFQAPCFSHFAQLRNMKLFRLRHKFAALDLHQLFSILFSSHGLA